MEDKYANQAVITIVESSLNTLTFQKLETGLEMMSSKAWVIHRIDWYTGVLNIATFNASGDRLDFGISQAEFSVLPAVSSQNVVDIQTVSRQDIGTAASGEFVFDPHVIRDFSNLPGGGLLVIPNPLYGFVQGTGLAAAMTVRAKLYYTTVELKDAQFYELWQSKVLLTS